MKKDLLSRIVSCLVLTSSASVASAVKVDLNNRCLIDDGEAQALSTNKASCPLSVHGVPNRIAQMGVKPEDVEELILFGNNFSMAGAQFVLDYALKHLPNLHTLDFSVCWIDENAAKNEQFSQSLANLLQKEAFKSIILIGNGIATKEWVKQFFSEHGDLSRAKLKWHYNQMEK